MKRTSIFYFSLAAIAAGSFASCQEADLGFDEEAIKAASYERQFVEKFGQPAENHQWGFDIAEFAFNFSKNNYETRAMVKQDMPVPPSNYWPEVLFGRPDNITQKEHDEVYAWFTNHKVKWANTPTMFNGERTTQTENNNPVAYLVENPVWPANCSLLKAEYGNVIGDYTFGEVGFFNGWVQHVANDPNNDEHAKSGDVYSSMNMDHLCFHDYSINGFPETHLYDFNHSYGYGNPDFDPAGFSNNKGHNAELVTESNFNLCTYGSSASSSTKHDKYYLVHLKGDDYEGWYLGMDFEAWEADANDNELVPANGICNDWIIKLSDVGNNIYNPARIFCEDLGGSFDTDFNDIVYDVETAENNKLITITMQAAGGTMPIKLVYGDTDLTLNGESEIHSLFGVSTTTPVNVKPDQPYKKPVVWRLGFENYNSSVNVDLGNGIWGPKYPDHVFSESFDFSKINVYVKTTSKAEWVNITLLDKSSKIPCRLCVPNTTKWPQELKDISKAYSSFNAWVLDPTVEFWNGTKNDGLLYTIPN